MKERDGEEFGLNHQFGNTVILSFSLSRPPKEACALIEACTPKEACTLKEACAPKEACARSRTLAYSPALAYARSYICTSSCTCAHMGMPHAHAGMHSLGWWLW